MLFDYNGFKESLFKDSDPEKQKIYTDFISHFGDNRCIEDEPFFTEYLNLFDYIPYRTPSELPDDAFEWGHLQKLIAGSFSSKYTYVILDQNSSIADLKLTVGFKGSVISRTINDLTDIQIIRLFQIFTEEQMSLAIIAAECLNEKEYILYEREKRIKLHNVHGKKLINYDEFSQYISYEKLKIKQLMSLSFKKNL